ELIADRCETLMTEMCKSEKVDLVKALAAPLPVTVIAHMLGVEDGNTDDFKYWSDTIFSNIGDILMANPNEEVVKAAEAMDAYFLGRINALRKNPQDHLLSRLIATETEDGHLSDAEILSFCRLLLIAGNETTTGLITGIVRVFNDLPETFEQLKANPELIPSFVEETLRVHSPFSVTIRRTAKDCTLADNEIPKGVIVLPLIACANRDETVFENPEAFVIDRSPNPHLAFGFGAHNCLGAHLARLEGEIAVQSMLKHLDGICIADMENFDGEQLGGPSELLVKLTPVNN
ncbi:MAG: cytochrome P450, partial [Candidatus Azotimanducaceae bacterium]